jgi:glycosyltransferase involved in cell wall biosynthesis
MITILQFIDNLRLGGKERQCVELLKGLSTRTGFRNRLAVMDTEVFYKEVDDVPDLLTRFLIREWKQDPRIFWTLFRLCQEWKPDIITVWDSMTAIYAAPISKLLGIRLVNAMILEAPEQLTSTLRWRSRVVFPLSDAIVANSRAGLRSYGVNSPNARVIHSGYDVARLAEISLEDPESVKRRLQLTTPFVVGMVANFTHYKDHQTFIRAAQLILSRRRNVTFAMVGAGVLLESCRAMVRADERTHIRFLGRLPEAIEPIVSTFDVGVLATFTEGISNSIMEYMMLQKPVVASDGGAVGELVLDGQTGYLVRPRDPQDLAEKIACLLDDPSLRLRMGTLGKQRVEQGFTLEQTTDQFAALYESCMNRPPQPSPLI